MTENSRKVERRRYSFLTKSQDDAASMPATKRGVKTRNNLISAARKIFERDGFLDSRLIDITSEAKISVGSFYTYFESKEDLFAAVLSQVEDEMLHPDVRALVGKDDPAAFIRASNRAYLESYDRNAKFMKLLNQVSSIDENFSELRRLRGEAFIERNARSIRDLQERGLADTQVDAYLAASVLSGMVGRAAYSNFVLGGRKFDLDELTEALTVLWLNALNVKDESLLEGNDHEGSNPRE